ncbi:MAG: sigma-54-dependent Fis family transcriptional regulator [Sedimentisphaerales bacterium]|nr:sigma-54-dependent Fis family transcriptional regulator [Sedimentisphaerales bacterium]
MSAFSERTLVVLYGDDLILRRHIVGLIHQLKGLKPQIINKLHDFGRLLEDGHVGLAVFIISESPDHRFSDNFKDIMDFIPHLRRKEPYCQILLIASSKLTLEQSFQAARSGVAAIIDATNGHFDDKVSEHINQAYRHHLKLQRQHTQKSPQDAINNLVGNSNALTHVMKLARRAAQVSDVPVVIYGESGTGKQRLAEIIHEMDEKRHLHPFVCVNCAAISGTLAESELFGHRKGAFTGATEDRLGYFRAADGGVILLDEIGELSLSLQPKILRVLQEGLVMPVGSDREYHVDVRVVAATHRDLKEMVQAGTFRLDLYQRLNVIQLRVPSLRERKEDIPKLFEHFLEKYAHYSDCRIQSVDPQIYEILSYNVDSGNIRELENIVRQILIFKEHGDHISVTDLPPQMHDNTITPTIDDNEDVHVPDTTIEALASGGKRLSDAVEEYERFMLSRLIDRGISQTVLASSLGITRRTLYNKLQKYNLR